jgi:hypothetical protein
MLGFDPAVFWLVPTLKAVDPATMPPVPWTLSPGPPVPAVGEVDPAVCWLAPDLDDVPDVDDVPDAEGAALAAAATVRTVPPMAAARTRTRP